MMGQYVTSLTGAMTFKELASTRMMCPDVALETEFAQILERATHYEIDGDMLLILSNGEMQAVLHAINAK
jgi:heat shock protein HslJ